MAGVGGGGGGGDVFIDKAFRRQSATESVITLIVMACQL